MSNLILAIAKIYALHRPYIEGAHGKIYSVEETGGEGASCEECSRIAGRHQKWPCATITVVNRMLSD